ncbi:hypothetical protein NRB56_65860 [Nocardia sp. RB56]|uniref:YibE/F family protein n=1 Tax=Nocardia aurantia TaxID=2585199 RepID=A0A7K0DYU5_9NOCA|nr:hypothetical protein [Nocardia aurantia]
MSDHHHHHHSGPLEIGTTAKRVVIGLLTGIGVLVLIGAVWMWPSHQHVDIPLPMQNGVGGAMQTESGTVVMQDIGPCGSLSNGKVFDDTPAAPRPNSYDCQRSTVSIDSGPHQGKKTLLEIAPGPGQPDLHAGDHIRLVRQNDPSGVPVYSFDDFSRGLPLTLILICFVVVIVVVARWRGLRAVLGLGIAFGVLVLFLLPALLDGKPAVPVALIAGAVILYAVLYLAHGVNLRTSSALLGTLSAMVLAAVLSWLTLKLTHVTGLSEEQNTNVATYLQHVSITGMLLAGFIIGSLGVLNDVTITQASAAFELATLDKAASRREVFAAAMRVGRDHIASTVYTLVLAYAGGALPLLLLFSVAGRSITDVLTGDAVAIEIARSAVGGICLALSVPLTTVIAVMLARPFGAAEPVAARRGTARRPRRDVEDEPPRTRSRRPEQPARRREPASATGEQGHVHEDDDLDQYYADLHDRSGPGGARRPDEDAARPGDAGRRAADPTGRGSRATGDPYRSGELPAARKPPGDPYRSGEQPAVRRPGDSYRSGEQSAVRRPVDPYQSGEQHAAHDPGDPYRSGEQHAAHDPGDPYRSGEQGAAHKPGDPYRSGEQSAVRNPASDPYRSGEQGAVRRPPADPYRSGEYPARSGEQPAVRRAAADPYRSGEYPARSAEQPAVRKAPADPYRSGEYPAGPGSRPADPYRPGGQPAATGRPGEYPADPYRSGEHPAAGHRPVNPAGPYGSGEFASVPPNHGNQPPPAGPRYGPDQFTGTGQPQPEDFSAWSSDHDAAPDSGGFSAWNAATPSGNAGRATPPRRLGNFDPHTGEFAQPYPGSRSSTTGYGQNSGEWQSGSESRGRHSSADDYGPY